MRYFSAFIFTFCFSFCYCQNDCDGPTLGDFFNTLKKINPDRKSVLKFKKFASFSFKDFKPKDESSLTDNFFEIGYNSKGEIEEIIHRTKTHSCENYKMLVFDCDDYRVLLLKTGEYDELEKNDEFQLFHVVAFAMMKNGNGNFVINLFEQFYDRGAEQYSTKFFPGSIEKMSAIMFIDENFFPIGLYKFSERQLVQHSDFIYEKKAPKVLKYEIVGYFFNTKERPSLIIDESTCPFTLLKTKYIADEGLPLYPIGPSGCEIESLWLYNGAHQYKNCWK